MLFYSYQYTFDFVNASFFHFLDLSRLTMSYVYYFVHIYIFSMHACIASPPIQSKCFFKSSRSKIRSQHLMSSSLNGEGGGQLSPPIFIPAFSQRLSQFSLSSSDKDKYQQLRTACHASKSDNNTLSELTVNSTRTPDAASHTSLINAHNTKASLVFQLQPFR